MDPTILVLAVLVYLTNTGDACISRLNDLNNYFHDGTGTQLTEGKQNLKITFNGHIQGTKAELLQLNQTQIPSLRNFVNKKKLQVQCYIRPLCSQPYTIKSF